MRMRYKHTTLFLSILFVLFTIPFLTKPAMAQRMGVRTAMPSSTYVGVRGGLGIDGESIDPPFSDFTLSTHTGFLLGGQLDYWMTDQWALSVQLLYDQKGASLTSAPNSFQTETDNLKLNYIEGTGPGEGRLRIERREAVFVCGSVHRIYALRANRATADQFWGGQCHDHHR